MENTHTILGTRSVQQLINLTIINVKLIIIISSNNKIYDRLLLYYFNLTIINVI